METIYSPEKMRERFSIVKAEVERIESTSPRLERDANFLNLTQHELMKYDEKIAKHEEGLFELKQELGFLARSLGGRSMSQGK